MTGPLIESVANWGTGWQVLSVDIAGGVADLLKIHNHP